MPPANAQTPNRVAEILGPPPPRRVRTGSREAQEAGDDALCERRRPLTWDRAGGHPIDEGNMLNAFRLLLES